METTNVPGTVQPTSSQTNLVKDGDQATEQSTKNDTQSEVIFSSEPGPSQSIIQYPSLHDHDDGLGVEEFRHIDEDDDNVDGSEEDDEDGGKGASSQKPRHSSIMVTLPYTTVYDPDYEFSLNDSIPITARIVDYEFHKNLVSPYVYNVELCYGEYKWYVRRKYHHYLHLHNQIWLYKTKMALPLPTENSRENRRMLNKYGEIEFPHFPMMPETILMQDKISNRIVSLSRFTKRKFFRFFSLCRNY